jgi:hypothetical protein
MKKITLCIVLFVVGVASQSVFAGTPPPPSVPDSSATAALLTAGLGGLFCLRRYFRR